MRVALGSDKSGFLLKEAIKTYLTEQGIEFEDMGTQDLEHGKPYYEAAPVVARAVQSGKFDRGILICGTGMGMSLVANKFDGIYAACVESVYGAKMCRSDQQRQHSHDGRLDHRPGDGRGNGESVFEHWFYPGSGTLARGIPHQSV